MLTAVGDVNDVDTIEWSGTAWDVGWTSHEISSDDEFRNAGFVYDSEDEDATTPTGSISSAIQKTNGSGYVDVSISVDDEDDHDLRAKIEYETDTDAACNGPWTKATLLGPTTASFNDSGGVPNINNADDYQIGTNATTNIVTYLGPNTVTFDWDTKTDIPAANSSRCLRVISNDFQSDQATPGTIVLTVDNISPTGLGSFVSFGAGSTTEHLNWSPASDTNFSHYEIWHSTNQTDVENRTGTAIEFDESDFLALASAGTYHTHIIGQTPNTNYFYKIWAVDLYGNEQTVPGYFHSTSVTGNSVPVVMAAHDITQATDGTGYVTFSTHIRDADLQETLMRVRFSEDGGSTFYNAKMISVSTVPTQSPAVSIDVNDFQIGKTSHIKTTSSGGEHSVAMTLVWDTKSVSNQNGGLNNLFNNDVIIQLTPRDTTEEIGVDQNSVLFTVDNRGPILSETGPVGVTNDNTPVFSFSSDENGTIVYGGSCSSVTTSAVAGTNNITLNPLADGEYTNCTITVTDGFNNSNILNFSDFKIDTVQPVLNQISTIGATNDSTPNYTFSSNEIGDIGYLGGCSSSTTEAIIGNNTITLNSLADGTYSSCQLQVTDEAGNIGSLSISSFTIDTQAPDLTQTDPIGISNDSTPDYTYTSDEAGTNIYAGGCTSLTTTTSIGSNLITFSSLADATYGSCTITVTDTLGNSAILDVSSFTIDTLDPVISETTPIANTNDNTPNYSFSSDETGSISYGGICSGNLNTAAIGSNTTTLDNLPDGSYSNCTITVTDSAGNFDTLIISDFTINTQGPILTELTLIGFTNDNTPSYTFSSDKTGTIIYSGGCTSLTTSAVIGTNDIVFESLSDGTYNSCNINLTDGFGNQGNLGITGFTVDTLSPDITEDTPIGATNDNTPAYTFEASEPGNLSYSGNCSSTESTALLGLNTINLDSLSEGNYTNCSITLTDEAGNSGNLDITNFEIDTQAPILNETGAIGNTNDSTPSYTFTSNESGTLSYNGACVSADTSGNSGSNTIVFNSLPDSTYTNCTIRLTDDAGNFSDLTVSDFTINTVAVLIFEITVIGITNDNTPAYSFTVNKTGNIIYSGGCTSATGSATTGFNNIVFNLLADDNYSNCEITFSDIYGNTAQLEITTFEVDTIAPILNELVALGTIANTTPTYEFSSSETGTITYQGSCSSLDTVAAIGDNSIAFAELLPGTYFNCIVSVTDVAGNTTDLNVSTFTITGQAEAPQNSTQSSSTPFGDVSGSSFSTYIENLYLRNIISGYSDGSFKPDTVITRSQLSKFIVNAFKLNSKNVTVNYSDLDQENKFSEYIGILSTLEIADGYSDGSFRPEQPITRAEAAKLVVKVLELKRRPARAEYELTFPDVAESDKFARYITYLSNKSTGQETVINGYSDGTFRPNAPITRGEMAKILWNSMIVGDVI
jgi:hypothetical protein